MDPFLCEVCHRPSPDLICSRRCKGLRKQKALLNTAEVHRRILEELTKLDQGASICPSSLAKTVLDSLGMHLKEERDALSVLREVLFKMRDESQLRFFQKNVLVPKGKGPMDIRGPFRLKRK